MKYLLAAGAIPGGDEHDDRTGRTSVQPLSDGDAVDIRKPDVQEHDVGPQALRVGQRVFARRALAGHLEALALEQGASRASIARAVVDDEDGGAHGQGIRCPKQRRAPRALSPLTARANPPSARAGSL